MAELSNNEHFTDEGLNSSRAKQILLAEDEPAVRGLLERFLQMWGYRTLVARTGKEALEIAEHHLDDIDVLLADVTMPEMDGLELAEKLTKKRPRIKVILMSGFSNVSLVVERGWKFIQKPFKAAQVKKLLEEVI